MNTKQKDYNASVSIICRFSKRDPSVTQGLPTIYVNSVVYTSTTAQSLGQ